MKILNKLKTDYELKQNPRCSAVSRGDTYLWESWNQINLMLKKKIKVIINQATFFFIKKKTKVDILHPKRVQE